MATYYVDNSGSPACSDTGGQPGTEAQPWCTLKYAVDHDAGGGSFGAGRIAAGDTVYVKNGTYGGGFTIYGPSGTVNNPTIMSAFPGHRPIFDNGSLNSGRIKITHGCSYITFTGFVITNHNQGLYVDDDANTDTPCTNVTVDNVIVHDVGQEGIAIRGGVTFGFPSFITVKNSHVYNTGMTRASNGEGVYAGTSSGGADTTHHITLLNNIIHHTQDECIELKGGTHDCVVDSNVLYACHNPGSSFGAGGGAIEIDEATVNSNHTIRNNIIRDMTNNGSAQFGVRAGNGATIYNNIVYNLDTQWNGIEANNDFAGLGNTNPRLVYHNTVDLPDARAIVLDGDVTATAANNIGSSLASNNVIVNSAYFVDYTGHNYHLVPTASAVINTGQDLTSTVPTDKDGISRRTNGLPDLGAYELGTAATQVTSVRTLRFG